MSHSSRKSDDKSTVTPAANDDDVDAVKKASDEYALNPIGTGSSGKGSRTTKGGHLRLASSSDDGDEPNLAATGESQEVESASIENGDRGSVIYKVYKRRWFGLVQLTLLNIIVSWDVSVFLVPVWQRIQSPMWLFTEMRLRDLPIGSCLVASHFYASSLFVSSYITASPRQECCVTTKKLSCYSITACITRT